MLHKRQNTLRKAYALSVLVAAHSGQIAKTRQKLHSKNSWNCVVILVSATIWQVLNVKCIKTGNANDVNQLKIALKNSWNHIKWTYFWRILPIWYHVLCAAVDFNGAILTKNVKTQRELGLPWTVRILVVIRSASVPRSSLVVLVGEEKIGNLFKMFLIYVPIQYPQ